jgi:septum site-determining protein MinC
MPVSAAGRPAASFDIKGANLPLVSLLLRTADLSQLAQDLQTRFGDTPDFFDDEPLVVDLAELPAEATAPVDFGALVALLRPLRLRPMFVRGGAAQQMDAALAAGLQDAPDAMPATRRAAEPVQPVSTSTPAPVEGPVAAAPPVSPSAMVVDKPLRSGQRVYARGRDLVVLAMVNAGAEVIADGHIHVYAPLRGKAIAGARGNEDARIFALSLEPELVSIAGVYRTSDVPLPDGIWGKASQVWLEGGAQGRLQMRAITA